MTSDRVRLAEGILHDYDPRDRPDGLELVERLDLLMWTRPSPTKWSSSVRWALWSENEADQRIDEVLAFYRERGRPFVWHIGPSSAPPDLARRLERRGLIPENETTLLVATLPVAGLRTNSDVVVVEARAPAQVGTFLRFGHPDWNDEEVRSELPDRLRFLDLYRERAGFLVAYLADAPVANAAWRDSADGHAVYLTGAGTKREHRGEGIYQTLVQYRLDRALARGCHYAVIQAQSDTSMPILLRRGFVPAGRVAVLSWTPAARS